MSMPSKYIVLFPYNILLKILITLYLSVRDIIKHKVISAPNEKVKTEAITSTSKRSLIFPSLESVVDFDFNAQAFAKRVKRTGPAYIVMKVLQMFREQEKRDPSPTTRSADILKLLNIRDEYSTTDVIPDTYFDHVFGQISPSAAITGNIQPML